MTWGSVPILVFKQKQAEEVVGVTSENGTFGNHALLIGRDNSTSTDQFELVQGAKQRSQIRPILASWS
jgi:hypothetical protein